MSGVVVRARAVKLASDALEQQRSLQVDEVVHLVKQRLEDVCLCRKRSG
jgi:hypothetical protein